VHFIENSLELTSYSLETLKINARSIARKTITLRSVEIYDILDVLELIKA
jgi:hypothetical protein